MKIISTTIAILFCTVAAHSSIYVLSSPRKIVTATLSLDSIAGIAYSVKFHENKVIRNSVLGIISDYDSLGKNVKLHSVKKEKLKEKYKTRGFHKNAINYCHQYTFELSSQGKIFLLQFRLYDDGVAFRYIVNRNKKQHIKGELSSFSCPLNTPVWYFERPNEWKLKSYAGLWTKTMSDSLHLISPTGPIQGVPLVYELGNNKYMVITEAALYNYSGMRLEAKKNAELQVNFTEKDGFDINGDVITPWRVVLLTDNLNKLVNSDLISNLNPSPEKKLFSNFNWIKPGKSVWSWWSEPTDYLKISLEKHFVDRAAELNFQYTTLDEGWEKWDKKWNVLKEFCSYAKERNIGVFVWKHSKELNFPRNDYQTMELFFDSLQQVGVKGIKIDFMNGETKSLIDFEIRALQLAAERQLMINFHGCQKPTGESRTYPNEITREAIRGLELNKMNQPIPGSHNVALIFTRCILNNSDYTPVGFSRPGNTSWTHQLATAYSFTSPLITLAEHPDTIFYNKELVAIIPFLKKLPTVWDETIVLDGSSIGEISILARRSDQKWYLVILNGQGNKTINVKLSFLKKGKWAMTSVKDDMNIKRRMIVEKSAVTSTQTLSINLMSEGGFLAEFSQDNF
ncbi:MAG TPA: glycoside hydrolase family 97 catalytic domain-containing protein [Paludibacteraceae bacterium]|nr:glycoside hydrolase family 97 catalytic domain-containing protein [Paludibacteraceae bacterium]